MVTQLELSNMIMRDVEGVKESGLPLDAFPEKVQEIILNLHREDGYSMEYTAIAILSATATAIGNSYHVCIRGSWVNSPCLYIILVGLPGQGKTPPLDFAYKPIQDYDYDLACKFEDDYDSFQASQAEKGKGDNSCQMEKPKLIQTILSDFTPEAMMRQHYNNQRGIVILVDEIMGMFNSINRYNDNPLITQLLTAYSGKQLKVTRCNNPVPIIIRSPCINIIGTTQTQRIAEFFTNENVASGLIDRFMFVLPKDQKPPLWGEPDKGTLTVPVKRSSAMEWERIVRKLLEKDCPIGDDGKTLVPIVLNFSDDAKAFFFEWRDRLCQEAYSANHAGIVDSRVMKMDSNVGRLALVFQLMKWASGESHNQYINLDSVKSAIRVHQYLEDSYCRIASVVTDNALDLEKREFLKLLGESFTTAEAIAAGAEVGMSESGVKKSLAKLTAQNILNKVAHGKYEKVQRSTYVNFGTLGTFTLSKQGEPHESAQSTPNAEVLKCNEKQIDQ